MTADQVTAALMADLRFAEMIAAEDGSFVMEGERLKLSACCAPKLARLTHYAKTALPVKETHMFKERSTGLFVAFLSVN